MNYTVMPSGKRMLAFIVGVIFSIESFFGAFIPLINSTPAYGWGEFTYKDEIELGKKFSILIKSRMPLIQDTEITQYVEGIVKRLSASLPSQPVPFTTSVILHPSINAFATPGGYLFINTGLILAMEHESELAAVIAHEMAHITQRHIARRIENSQLVGLFSVLGALAGALLGGEGGMAAASGSIAAGQAAMLKYSREDESEADQVGMSYLIKAGYSPQGFVGAFQKMSKKQWDMGINIPTYLSTHPGLLERIKDMSVRVNRQQGTKAIAENDTKFFRIQTLVRANYSDPAPAAIVFSKQLGGTHRCMALMGQGILASRQNNVTKAAQRFEEALACAPHDELIIREAGRFHYTKGNKDKGMELLAKAVSMDRSDLMALFFYSRGLADNGETIKALGYMRDILRRLPEDPEIYFFMARYYGQLRDLFTANLYMAYSALYENDKKKVEQFFQKSRGLATTPEQAASVERFEKIYKERRSFW